MNLSKACILIGPVLLALWGKIYKTGRHRGDAVMFYENFVALCQARGESPSRVAQNAGLSRAAASSWKQNPSARPTAAALEKLAAYLGVSPADLLEDAPHPAPQPSGFYPHFCALCRSRGVSPSRAAEDAGISKSAVSKWKREPDTVPSGTVLAKLSAYFGLPTSQILGEPPAPTPTDEALKFALFGGAQDITPEMFEEVRSFAHFVLEREQKKKK